MDGHAGKTRLRSWCGARTILMSMCSLLTEGQVTGALVGDAALAALAIEYGATLFTTDRDFTRFGGLRQADPLQS